eukprot:jgi/Chrpa1/10165/Chrysochromulina_OHIO_Genome00001571-RA
MLRETDSEYSAKHVEIIYRERVRREKEKAMQVQLDLEDQLHKKTNLDMLLKRALKEKADLLVKNTALTSENVFMKLEKAKLEKATAKLQAELKALQARADERACMALPATKGHVALMLTTAPPLPHRRGPTSSSARSR